MTFRKGIPTEYAGVVFRSRVEARWAAFFDVMGWPWEYEPLDLQGYVPDFALRFTKPLLVEVKYELSFDALEQYTPKLEASGWGGEFLIVGACPLASTELHPSDCVVGLFGELYNEREGIWWQPGIMRRCPKCTHGLQPFWGLYVCRRCGDYSGGHCEAHDMADALWYWRQASNRVQWKRPSK